MNDLPMRRKSEDNCCTMNDAQLERILKEQREEYQRFVGVIFEDFKSGLQLIAQSVEGLQKQLSDLREMVARNAEDI